MSGSFTVALTNMCGADQFAEGTCLPRRTSDYISVPVLTRIDGKVVVFVFLLSRPVNRHYPTDETLSHVLKM